MRKVGTMDDSGVSVVTRGRVEMMRFKDPRTAVK